MANFFEWTSAVDDINVVALFTEVTKLYIEPIVIASLEYGRGLEEIPLDTIVVDLMGK